jgi:adenosylcobinamide-GDP ribazoletransferase
MREQITAAVVAAQFLTMCPPLLRRVFTAAELGRSVAFFPLVGAAIGGLLALASLGLSLIFPPGVTAALLLVIWVIVTGSLHVDGFLDSCDGLLGGFTPDERLRIMRDERVGGYALAGGALLFIVKYAALSQLATHLPGLFMAPVLGRWAMTAAIVLFPYAREKGLGRDMKNHAGAGQLVLASAIAIACAAIVGWQGLVALAVAVVLLWCSARFIIQRIPGLTGDSYGAICEIVEVGTLLVFAAAGAL